MAVLWRGLLFLNSIRAKPHFQVMKRREGTEGKTAAEHRQVAGRGKLFRSERKPSISKLDLSVWVEA